MFGAAIRFYSPALCGAFLWGDLLNIKTLIISALLTLIVTVIGGALVDYIASEKPWQKNKLEYSYRSTGAFQSGEERLEFNKIEITNTGSQSQKSIEAEIDFKATEIQDIAIPENSKSLKPLIEKSQDSKKFSLRVATLFPKETITVELLTKANKEEKPSIFVRSTTTKATFSPTSEKESNSPKAQTAKTVLLILAAVVIFSFIIGKKTLRTRAHSPNNIGFLLLHANEIDAARKYFERDLENAISGSFSLSNFALYKALSDNAESARPYLEAAKFYADTNHEKAVTAFNEAIIDALLGLNEDAEQKLTEAIRLSKKEISKYCNYSKILQHHIPNFNELINKNLKPK